jgi:hypothetical protein
MATTHRITLKTADGTTLFTGMVTAAEIIETPTRSTRPAANGQPPADNGDRMTDPQKRYLFRLLGAQGTEGKQAEAHLKEYFGVARLTDIPKDAASKYIDQLAKDKKDATA